MKRSAYTLEEKVDESVRFIRQVSNKKPRLGIVLGSGLGYFAESLTSTTSIDTSTIPHYPKPTIEGHEGKLLIGTLHEKTMLLFQGRVHYYESGDLESVLYPIRIAHALGVRTLLLTNAAGGINSKFRPADLMLITDHINLTHENPSRGISAVRKNTPVYDLELQKLILLAAKSQRIKLQRGVYCGLKGPSYETVAEVQLARHIGSDAVGMSTVNEATFAQGLGMRVAGISCITNLSTGISDQKLSHNEVTDVAQQVQYAFSALLDTVIERLD